MSKQWNAPELLQLSGAYWQSCALQCAVQLDLITVLSERAYSVRELADTLACEQRSFRMLITALVALEILDKEGEQISVPESVQRVLSRTSPDYMGFIIQHHAHIMPGWSRLATAVRTGSPTRDESTLFTDDTDKRRDFLMGMFNIARLQAQTIADALDLSACASMIDIGGGPGTYAVYFCRKNPQLSATIFDLPTSEPFATEVITSYNLTDRVRFVPGDFLHDPLPANNDMAWLSQVLHGESPANASLLVKEAARSLNPGGFLCIQEFVLNDDGAGPVHSALFNLNMLVQTDGGQAYTQGDLTSMLMDAGARDIRILDVRLPNDCRVLVGTMP